MKFIISLFMLFIVTESCNSTKETTSKLNESNLATATTENSMTSKDASIISSNTTSGIIYEASSRGFYEYIEISGMDVTISSDRNLKTIKTYSCSEEDAEELNILIKDLDTYNLSKLKAPTDKRLYDAAAHATLTIREGDMMIKTPTFDHGYPPKEIEAVVNKVLSIKESVVKQ